MAPVQRMPRIHRYNKIENRPHISTFDMLCTKFSVNCQKKNSLYLHCLQVTYATSFGVVDVMLGKVLCAPYLFDRRFHRRNPKQSE